MEDIISSKAKKVRVDEATNDASVLDVIGVVVPGVGVRNRTNYLKRIMLQYPDLKDSITYLRINGKGKITRVANFQTLIQIAWMLPGSAARDYRLKSCHQICRLLGGDESLIPEIEARNAFWKSTPAREQQQQALLQPMTDMKRVKHEQEKDVQMQLARSLKGITEVKTESGSIDVLSEDALIEVKHHDKWKSAIGQVLAYSLDYPNKRKRIHLFGDLDSNELAVKHTKLCEQVCDPLDIDVTLELRNMF